MSHETKTHTPPLWRNPNYLLLQSGQIVSYLGNQQQFIALPLLILAITGSTIQAGIAVSLNTIAVLVVSPLAGALVDRWDRKRTMLVCDAGRMLLTLSIPLAYWLHVLSMAQIYIAVTLAGAFGTLFSVANTAALPNVVTRKQLPVALSQAQVAYSCVRTFGSLIGGTLYSIGNVFPFLANGISFGASVLSLSFIRGRFQSESEASPRQSLHQTITEGFTWLWRQPLLRFLTIINGADSLRYGAGYLVILILAQNLHTSPSGIGFIFTGAAVGALLGNIASHWARQRFPFGKIAISMLWLEALMFPLYAIAPNAFIMCLIAAAEELVGPIYNISLDTYRLTATPDTMRGRMSSTVQLVTQGAQSLGAILGGLLIQIVGAQWSALILGAWLILLAIATTLNHRVRHATLPTPEPAV
ncbi:MFS transporter [Ktedonospora formicarum]|uniref:MFS transporter n=1 Tax=Ktedonospora formicarum TaxID=2778364 RepID=A0A8J3I5U8_9CHLR|nr:MFS transporter [Ktedonospora formicarum]GHO46642.1 MFS transporter [Ktedonospora formicarum]